MKPEAFHQHFLYGICLLLNRRFYRDGLPIFAHYLLILTIEIIHSTLTEELEYLLNQAQTLDPTSVGMDI